MSIDDDGLLIEDPIERTAVAALDEPGEGLGELHAPVQLMRDGRLRAPKVATQRFLGERLGEAVVFPTGPGWALFRTVGVSGPPSPLQAAETQREVVMAGALGESGVSLMDVVGFLASSLETGVLTVSTDEADRSIYLNQGDVVWADSTASSDQIGEFLVRRGKIFREQLEALQPLDPRQAGRACVDHGLIESHDLWAMVQSQLTEIFDRVLQTDRGIWTFGRITQDQLAASQVHMSTQGLLMDALRKVDEMRLYREVVRSANSVLERQGAPVVANDDPRLAGLDGESLEPALQLLRCLSRPHSIYDLMRVLGKSEFDVTRLAYQLKKRNLVRVQVVDAPAVAPPPGAGASSRVQPRDLLRIYGLALREILSEFGQGGEVATLLAAGRAFLGGAPPPHDVVFRTFAFGPDGLLAEGPILEAVGRGGFGANALHDALSELLFFLLFEAGERMAPRRRDELARRVKMIHGMLVAGDEDEARRG